MAYFDQSGFGSEPGKKIVMAKFGQVANLDRNGQPCEVVPFPMKSHGVFFGQELAVEPANSQDIEADYTDREDSALFSQLPLDIQDAIEEWADHLKTQNWMLRRRAMERFAMCFADNFLAHMPNMDDEEYDSLRQVGYTCLLERLDSGAPITDAHQARCYENSVHEHHRMRAQVFLKNSCPKSVTLN